MLVQKGIDVYKCWHDIFQHLPKLSRYSLGNKIDQLFLNIIELSNSAVYAPKQNQKLIIEQLSGEVDNLKLFLRIAWEVKILDSRKYSALSIPLTEIGKIIGGWKKKIIE